MHGGQVNVTDGRFVYMRGPAAEPDRSLFNQPLHEYTLMPAHLNSLFSVRIAPMAPCASPERLAGGGTKEMINPV